MFRWVCLAACLAAAGFGVGVAVAATPVEARDAFSRLDADKDGRLAPTELQGPCGTDVFAMQDVNHDGQITPGEFQASGKIVMFADKGGIDTRNIAMRWLEFRIGDFNLDDQGIALCTVEEGQYPIDPQASAAEVEAAKHEVQSRLSQARQASVTP